MKLIKSSCKPLTREQMKQVTGGNTTTWPACSNKYCNNWCLETSGFGGRCYNGRCACLG